MAEATVGDPEDQTLEIVSGRLNRGLLSVYAVVRNEMFFLPAFLEHYRDLGVKQFVVLDDKSDDGSLEYLLKQDDAVILKSSYRYGDRIGGIRAGHFWKTNIPHRFLSGQWAICADADEFLHIPSQFKTLNEFVSYLDRAQCSAIAAVMVDFYPALLEDIQKFHTPSSKSELFDSYPWFDAGPYFDWPANGRRPILIQGGVRERLFQKYHVSKRQPDKLSWALWAQKLFAPSVRSVNFNSVHKVPLVKWTEGRKYVGSHTLEKPPDTGIVLPIAHFKFTSDLYRKIEMAIASKSYSANSQAYHGYAQLLAAMAKSDGKFVGPQSRKLVSVKDFVDAGLLKFER